MSTMSKFAKRITKFIKEPESALVLGTGFGMIKELTEIFDTVFVVNTVPPEFKARNLIYRQDFQEIGQIGNPSAILVDLLQLHNLNHCVSLWSRARPFILIEGNDLVDREKTRLLWNFHYRPVEQMGFFHGWKMMQ